MYKSGLVGPFFSDVLWVKFAVFDWIDRVCCVGLAWSGLLGRV